MISEHGHAAILHVHLFADLGTGAHGFNRATLQAGNRAVALLGPGAALLPGVTALIAILTWARSRARWGRYGGAVDRRRLLLVARSQPVAA